MLWWAGGAAESLRQSHPLSCAAGSHSHWAFRTGITADRGMHEFIVLPSLLLLHHCFAAAAGFLLVLPVQSFASLYHNPSPWTPGYAAIDVPHVSRTHVCGLIALLSLLLCCCCCCCQSFGSLYTILSPWTPGNSAVDDLRASAPILAPIHAYSLSCCRYCWCHCFAAAVAVRALPPCTTSPRPGPQATLPLMSYTPPAPCCG